MNLDLREGEQQPPSYDDFEVLKDMFLGVLEEPDTTVRASRKDGLWMKLERMVVDYDAWVWPPLSICITGIIRTLEQGNVLAIRYRELPYHDASDEANWSVNHDYVLAVRGSEVVKSVQSIRGCPSLPFPEPDLRFTDQQLREVSEGGLILEREFGAGLALTAGDCGVLYERLASMTT